MRAEIIDVPRWEQDEINQANCKNEQKRFLVVPFGAPPPEDSQRKEAEKKNCDSKSPGNGNR